MKKFMSLLLVGIMMLSLVACGKSGGGKGELNVGVFYYTYSDTYISSVRTALDNALTEAGIKFQNYDGNSNQTTQNEQDRKSTRLNSSHTDSSRMPSSA